MTVALMPSLAVIIRWMGGLLVAGLAWGSIAAALIALAFGLSNKGLRRALFAVTALFVAIGVLFVVGAATEST